MKKISLPRELLDGPMRMLEMEGEISIWHLLEISSAIEMWARIERSEVIDGECLHQEESDFYRLLREAAKKGHLKTRRAEWSDKGKDAFVSIFMLHRYAAAHGKKCPAWARGRLERLCDEWIAARQRHGLSTPLPLGAHDREERAAGSRGPRLHFPDLLKYAEGRYLRGEREPTWPDEAAHLAAVADKFPGRNDRVAQYQQIRKSEPFKAAYMAVSNSKRERKADEIT